MPFLVVLLVLIASIVYYVDETQVIINLPEQVRVKHPSWSDIIIPETGNRVHRKSNSDGATITNITDNSFVLEWDKWGAEIFQKDPETDVYTLKERKKKN